MKPRHKLVAVAMAVAAGASAGVTSAAFTASGSSPSNSFTSAADWSAPTATATTIRKTEGGTENLVKEGGTYHVYAQVTDGGNPAAGVAANGVTADVSAITSGQTAVPLSASGGPWTINGTSYNRRTATQLTATSPLGEGAKDWTVSASDTSSPVNSGTSGSFSATIDNTAPSAADIQTVNAAAGTNGRAEIGDEIVFTFSEPVEPESVQAGWTGSVPANVVVRLNNVGPGDQVQIYNSGNSILLPLGTINLVEKDYTTTNRTFGASGTPSTMVQSGSTITVTLGTANGAVGTSASANTMRWTPVNTPYDGAANAMSTTVRDETDASADKEF